MTKERKIAIEMWKYIRDSYSIYRDYIDKHDGDVEDILCFLKKQFLDDKCVHWAKHCWFCQYIGHRDRCLGTYRCKLCPLKSCDTGPYGLLMHGCTQSLYIDACNKIIKALGGD